MEKLKIIPDKTSYLPPSFEQEQEYFLKKMKIALEKSRRRETTIQEEINIFTGGRQVILKNCK